MNTIDKLMQADALLSQWLTDNTEEVFEEQPEIDEARTLIQEAAELLQSTSQPTGGEHTPGPWSVWTAADSMIDVAVGPDAGGVAVAQIVTANGQGINTTEAMERGQANARLIAAAPLMLKALERITHPMAGDDDLDFALEVIRQVREGTQ